MPEPPAEPPTTAPTRRLLRLLRPYRSRIIGSAGLAILVGLFGALSVGSLVPIMNSVLEPEGVQSVLAGLAEQGSAGAALAESIDGVVEGDRMRMVWLLVATLVVLSTLRGLVGFAHTYLVDVVCQRAQLDLAERLFDRVTEHDESTLARAGFSNLTARFTYDLDMTGKALTTLVGTLVLEPCKFAGALAMALLVSLELTLVALLVVPPVLLVGVWLGKRTRRSAEGMLEKRARLLGRVRETLGGLPVMQVYGQEERERRRFRDVTTRVFSWVRKYSRLDAVNSPLLEISTALGVAPVLLYGASRVIAKEMSPGEFIGTYALLALMFGPLRKSVGASNRLQGGLAGADRIFGTLDLQTEVRERQGARDFAPLADEMEWANVTVRYPDGRVALDRIDVHVPAGKTTALVGPSGAGKSTLLHTIPRLLDPTEGAVLFDGKDVRSARLGSLRGRMALVTQDARLFGGTLADNVAYARPGATRAEIEAAGRSARVDEIVERLPDGWDTVLDELGSSLSGGERQRIAIARAVLRDPEILLLDEPTSALDPENERLVSDALTELARGRTTVVVAHRRDTVAEADHVVVLRDGEVEAQGPPAVIAELSRTCQELFGSLAATR